MRKDSEDFEGCRTDRKQEKLEAALRKEFAASKRFNRQEPDVEDHPYRGDLYTVSDF